MEELEIIANNIKRLRKERGWTRDELAAASQISKKTIYRLEMMKQANPRLNILSALASALGVSLQELKFAPGVIPLHQTEAPDQSSEPQRKPLTKTSVVKALKDALGNALDEMFRDDDEWLMYKTFRAASELEKYLILFFATGRDEFARKALEMHPALEPQIAEIRRKSLHIVS